MSFQTSHAASNVTSQRQRKQQKEKKRKTPRFFWSLSLCTCKGKRDKQVFPQSCTKFKQPLLANAGYRARSRRKCNAMQHLKRSLLPLLLPPCLLSFSRCSCIHSPGSDSTRDWYLLRREDHHHRHQARQHAYQHCPAAQAAASAP